MTVSMLSLELVKLLYIDQLAALNLNICDSASSAKLVNKNIGKWSLPWRSSSTLKVKSKYKDGSQIERSMLDCDPVAEQKCVGESSFNTQRSSADKRSDTIFPCMFSDELPHTGE
jgi:hypothetical protein